MRRTDMRRTDRCRTGRYRIEPRQTALHQRVTFFVVHIEIRGIAFQQKRLFPIIEQIANQGEGQLILADDAFVYSNIKNGHVHVTDSRLMYRRQ